LASGNDLSESVSEALNYLDRCLGSGFRPGMGHVLPDRMFWAQEELDLDDAAEDGPDAPSLFNMEFSPHDTKH